MQYLVVNNVPPVKEEHKEEEEEHIERRNGTRRADDVKIDKMMDEISELKQFLQNPVNIHTAPEGYEDTNLDDDEIDDIMSTLLSFEEKYFKEIPLSRDLDKKFVWNIPKIVYEAHQYAHERDEDALDPLICLYALLTEDPLYTMGVYFDNLINNVIEQNGDTLRKAYDEYYDALSEEGKSWGSLNKEAAKSDKERAKKMKEEEKFKKNKNTNKKKK